MKQILMIMFLFLYTFLNATIINVPTDQTTIQAAINVAVNGDTILVMPGTYVENISFNGKLITVGSLFLTTQDTTYISSTIIDGNSSGSVVIFNNSENSASILVGFTIKNGNSTWGGGIHCEEASPSLNNLYIVNNYADYGGGILCNVNADITLSHLTIAGNNADVGGGIYCYQSNPTLEKVLLSSNTATIFGGGLFCYDNANFNIENVTMTNNSAGTSGGAIYCSDSYPDLVNSILWDNIPEEIFLTSGGTVTATYSDIEGGLTGTGNIDEDPLFVNPGNGDYHLQPTSPCIDAGDPNDNSGDVRIDMGAYETTTDVKPLKGNHWNWISFPRVQRPNNDPMINAPADAPAILTNMLPFLNNLRIEYLDGNMLTYDSNHGWHPDSYDIQSTKGYKLYIEDNSDFILPIQGIRLDSLYAVQLTAGENWVGYWLPGTATFDEALGAYKDRFTQIKAENWTMTKVNGTWIGPAGASFTYGKGYIMYVDPQNWHNGFEFKWNSPFAPGGREFKKKKTEHFTYEEKADYEVIDIQYIENGEDIEEIGAFVNGICVGASKVEDYPVQILAYTEDANKGGDDNTFYFEVVTSGKSEPKKLNDILVYNFKTVF